MSSTDKAAPLPTSAEDDAVVLARLSKTPAEAYERGYIDGAARERERIAESMRGLARLLGLPDKRLYPGDERHIEKRMLLALAEATVADSWPNVELSR